MLTLTTQELVGITGRKQAAAQIRWLARHQWVYAIGGDGMPKVARAYFERRMVAGETPSKASEPQAGPGQWQINTAAIRKPRKK